jgi:hypothetical protein
MCQKIRYACRVINHSSEYQDETLLEVLTTSREVTSSIVVHYQLIQNAVNLFFKRPVGPCHEVGVPTVGFSSFRYLSD